MESELLCELGFEVEVILPHRFITGFCQAFLPPSTMVHTYAIRFMNDSFRTTCPLFYSPAAIAAASIYMAVLFLERKKIKQELPACWQKLIDPELEL